MTVGTKGGLRHDGIGMGALGSAIYMGTVAASTVAIKVIAESGQLPTRAGDAPPYITVAVPFFFLLMAVEYVVGRNNLSVGGKYDFADSISSIVAGVVQQLGDVLVLKHIITLPYRWIHANYAVMELSMDTWLGWTVAMLGADLAYYWLHRYLHEINFMWAAHIVHHSSEHYHAATALRQSLLQSCMTFVFYLPLAFFVPISGLSTAIQWNLWFQFHVHTTAVRRLGPLWELVFSTPSHHRVHHDRRVHANYAGILIIWDRMFGTFIDEGEGLKDDGTVAGWSYINDGRNDENVVYGVTRTVGSWNPIKVQTQHWEHIARRIWNAGFAPNETLMILLRGPGYRPKLKRTHMPPINSTVKRFRYTTELSPSAQRYHLVQFALALLGGVFLMVFFADMPYWAQILLAAHTLLVCTCQGMVLDGNAGAATLENARNLCVCLIWVFVSRLADRSILASQLLAAGNEDEATLVTSSLHPAVRDYAQPGMWNWAPPGTVSAIFLVGVFHGLAAVATQLTPHLLEAHVTRVQ